jgi:hypothetical protein
MFSRPVSPTFADDIYTVRWSATMHFRCRAAHLRGRASADRADDWQPVFRPAVAPRENGAQTLVQLRRDCRVSTPWLDITHMRTSNSGTSDVRRHAAGHS